MRVLFIGLFMSCLALAQAPGSRKFQVTDTQRVEFPAAGVLHVVDSIDELTVEGWDRPDVEITTTKTTRDFYSSGDRKKVESELERLRVTAARREDEVLVSTVFPHRRSFPFVWSPLLTARVRVDCRIKVPYAARVMVKHGTGEVHLENIAGDIHAAVRRGGITLALPEEGQYTIDAKSNLGGVVSDFVGKTKKAGWIGGHRFTAGESGPHKVYVRVGYGDILLLKEPKTNAPGQVQ